MENPDCSLTCSLKRDLKNSSEKIALLKDSWPNFFEKDSIDKLAEPELRCTHCLLEVIIDALIDETYYCSPKAIIQLVMLRSYVENTSIIRELEKEQEILEEKLRNADDAQNHNT